MSAKECTTHHWGCDCREAMHKEDIARKNKLLRDALEWIRHLWRHTEGLSIISRIEQELELKDLDNG